MKLLRTVSLIAVCFFVCGSISFAEYNSEKLGEAAGAYLAATDVMIKLSQSECGYITKEKPNISLQETTDEILQHLNEQDAKELLSYIESQAFKDQMVENDEFISGFMSVGAEGDELDEKTLCGMLLSNVALQYSAAGQKWKDAIQLYADNKVSSDEKNIPDGIERKAASGDPESQYQLSLLYLENEIQGSEDQQTGIYWMKKAAIQGYTEALGSMAYRYFTGNGVENDRLKALEYFLIAANKGDKISLLNMKSLGSLFLQQNDSLTLIRRLANSGNAYAQFILANAYYHGSFIEKNLIAAFEYYKDAAENGYAKAQFDLGNMYFAGIGTDRDYAKGFKWTQKAAMNNHSIAQYNIAIYYCNGKGVIQDLSEAYKWILIFLASGQSQDSRGDDYKKNEATKLKYELSNFLSSDQIAQAKEEAAELWDKIQKQG